MVHVSAATGYPRKGALAVGSDADIMVLDTGIEKTIRAADLYETDYTPWEGHVVTARPSVTVLRGKVMVEGGQFFGDPKDGQFLPRKGRRDPRAVVCMKRTPPMPNDAATCTTGLHFLTIAEGG
jgi:dihydropyrimidinase